MKLQEFVSRWNDNEPVGDIGTDLHLNALSVTALASMLRHFDDVQIAKRHRGSRHKCGVACAKVRQEIENGINPNVKRMAEDLSIRRTLIYNIMKYHRLEIRREKHAEAVSA